MNNKKAGIRIPTNPEQLARVEAPPVRKAEGALSIALVEVPFRDAPVELDKVALVVLSIAGAEVGVSVCAVVVTKITRQRGLRDSRNRNIGIRRSNHRHAALYSSTPLSNFSIKPLTNKRHSLNPVKTLTHIITTNGTRIFSFSHPVLEYVAQSA